MKGLIMATRGRSRLYSFLPIVLLLLGPAACPNPSAQMATSVAPELKDLRSLDELKTLFNHDYGAPRLVLLLSPT